MERGCLQFLHNFNRHRKPDFQSHYSNDENTEPLHTENNKDGEGICEGAVKDGDTMVLIFDL